MRLQLMILVLVKVEGENIALGLQALEHSQNEMNNIVVYE